MRRNVSGQFVGAELIAKADGTPVTTGTTLVYVTGDAGTQTLGQTGSPSGEATHEGNGYWSYSPTQAETNFTHVAFTFVHSSAINATVQVYPMAYDSSGQVLLSNGTGTGQLKLANGYVAMTWADIAAPTTSVDLSGTTIATTQKVDVETIKTNPVVNGGTVTFPTDATLASTTNITAGTITTVTNLTNAPTNGDLTATMKASVNSEVDSAIETYHLDHLLAAAYDVTNKPGNASALLNAIIENRGSPSEPRFTAASLEQAPTGGSAPTAAQIRAEMDANSTQLAAIVADTNELQTDWADGGRLDLILDARASQSSVDGVPTAIENADALLNRDMSTGTDSGSSTVRTPRQALRFLRNKWSISGTTLTVTKEDDSTASWTATVTATAGADPITATDPAGP